MSVTFFLTSNERACPACEHCGAKNNEQCSSEQAQCRTCYGYGADPVDSTPCLNVTNTNARVLLVNLLDYEQHGSSDLTGDLDPADLKVRLALARTPARLESAQRPTCVEYSDGPRWVSFGVSPEQIERWLDALDKIAEVAHRRREPVVFG